MQTITRFLRAAFIAGAGLSAGASASAQTSDRINQLDSRQVNDTHGTMGGFTINTVRQWNRTPTMDRLWTLTQDKLYLRLFEGTKTIVDSQIDATADRNRTVGRPVSAGGYITFMGNRVLTAPAVHGQGDVAIDQAWESNTGTITFYEEARSFGFFPISVVTLRVFGRLKSQISAWAHTTPFPQQNGESDFSITQAKLDGEVLVRASIVGPANSITAGELRPLRGNIGGVSAAKRQFVPGFFGNRTRFTLEGSTPATASVMSGVINIRPGGGQTQEIAYWGNAWRFDTQVAPPMSKTVTIDGGW